MTPGIFNTLPQVKNFCFFFNLKTGCIIISVVYLLCIVEAVFGKSASKELNRCYYLDPFMEALGITALVVGATTSVVTLVFLLGIFKNVPLTAIYFMYTTIILLVFNLIMSVILSVFVSQKDCASPYLFGGASFFGAILLIYFLIVVNSYHRQITNTSQVIHVTTSQETTGQTKDSKPTDSQPTASKPAASKPTDSLPTDSKPTDSKPTDSKPTDSKLTDSKPTDSKLTDSKPTDSKPTDSKLTDSQPTASKPS